MTDNTNSQDINDMPAYMKFEIMVDLQGIRKDIEDKITKKWKETLQDIIAENMQVTGHEMSNKVMTNDFPKHALVSYHPPNHETESLGMEFPSDPEQADRLTMKGWVCNACGAAVYMTGTPYCCASCGRSHQNLKEGFKK